MADGLTHATQKCTRCEMPLLRSDVYCPFCGRSQINRLVPILRTVKAIVGVGALIAIGVPAFIVLLVSFIGCVYMLTSLQIEGVFVCLLVGGVAAAVLAFVVWAYRQVTAPPT